MNNRGDYAADVESMMAAMEDSSGVEWSREDIQLSGHPAAILTPPSFYPLPGMRVMTIVDSGASANIDVFCSGACGDLAEAILHSVEFDPTAPLDVQRMGIHVTAVPGLEIWTVDSGGVHYVESGFTTPIPPGTPWIEVMYSPGEYDSRSTLDRDALLAPLRGALSFFDVDLQPDIAVEMRIDGMRCVEVSLPGTDDDVPSAVYGAACVDEDGALYLARGTVRNAQADPFIERYRTLFHSLSRIE